MKLVYSSDALEDLMRLREFIAIKNPHAASRIANDLVTRIENLCLFPKMGVQVMLAPTPESIRDLIVDNYIVRYALHTQTITILRIWHGNEERSENI